jgi:osmotically-inducible protein OsmY
MSTRYDERDYDRERQNYGRRGESDYRSSNREQSPRRYRFDDSERETERYNRESELGGEYSGRYSPSSGRGYQSRGEYSSSRWEDDWESPRESRNYPRERSDYTRGRGDYSDREFGSYGRSYSDEGRVGDRSSYSQRFNYPTGFRSGERYSERGRGDYERSRYGIGERDYGYGRGGYGSRERNYGVEREGYVSGEPRGWWDRVSDEVASWFGDEEAERRRRMDQQREQFRGRGPKGYRRSDERIKEDVNDRLSEGYLDASDIEVAVLNAEVTLTGTVDGRIDKRKAEAIAESVTGVTNVENRLRVRQSGLGTYGKESTTDTGPMATAGPTGTTGTTGTSTTGTTSRGRGAGN